MTGHSVSQAAISIIGLCTMSFSLSGNQRLRWWAPWLGISVQPFWFWETWQRGQWGIFILSACYLCIYIRAALKNWNRV